MKDKIYLRIVFSNQQGVPELIGIFEGDVEWDRAYWLKHHVRKARYFKLTEEKK